MEEQKKMAVSGENATGDAQAAADGWQWCGVCGRASLSKMAYNCGYDGCDAGIESVFTWKYVRGINPDLPEIPVRDIVYAISKAK